MGKQGYLGRLRRELDEAITYGTKLKAVKLARQGLAHAEKKGLPGEIEYFKGQQELLKGNYASAIEHFDRAITHNPGDGASYNDRALCMVELGIIDEAFIYFDKGIAVEPDYATIYHNKGWLLNNIGHHCQAVEYFNKALALDANRAVTYDNLADALFNLSQYEKACQAYEKVLSLLKRRQCVGIRKQIKEKIRRIKAQAVLAADQK